MDNLSTSAKGGYSYNEAKKISSSFNAKHYDEIITKHHLQAREEEYERSIRYLQNQKIQQKRLHNQQKRKKRILLVDDEPDICMVYQIVLQDAGYECIPYTNSVKALKEFRLIIMIWLSLISKCLY